MTRCVDRRHAAHELSESRAQASEAMFPGFGALVRGRFDARVGQEVHPLDEVHGDEPPSVLTDELVEPDEVRVGQIGEGAKLALEGVGPRLVLQELERESPVAGPVPNLVDDAEAALTQPSFDAVPVRAAEEDRVVRVGGSRQLDQEGVGVERGRVGAFHGLRTDASRRECERESRGVASIVDRHRPSSRRPSASARACMRFFTV